MKFYSSEPNTLREELTRYQFFLQLKQDLLEGRLHSKTTDHTPIFSFDEKCAELCALALQCEYSIPSAFGLISSERVLFLVHTDTHEHVKEKQKRKIPTKLIICISLMKMMMCIYLFVSIWFISYSNPGGLYTARATFTVNYTPCSRTWWLRWRGAYGIFYIRIPFCAQPNGRLGDNDFQRVQKMPWIKPSRKWNGLFE